jgi:hypothetical protein
MFHNYLWVGDGSVFLVVLCYGPFSCYFACSCRPDLITEGGVPEASGHVDLGGKR